MSKKKNNSKTDMDKFDEINLRGAAIDRALVMANAGSIRPNTDSVLKMAKQLHEWVLNGDETKEEPDAPEEFPAEGILTGSGTSA
jgi:hypothetical protein